MIATEDGGYESASDYDEVTLALITCKEYDGDDSENEAQYMAPEDADRYDKIIFFGIFMIKRHKDAK